MVSFALMPRKAKPDAPTLADAIAEARKILARDEGLQQMPSFVREAELADPASIYVADREVAMVLLRRFVRVLESLDVDAVNDGLALNEPAPHAGSRRATPVLPAPVWTTCGVVTQLQREMAGEGRTSACDQ